MNILSPAKINLTLEILGRRPDGFHELDTWMLPVGLYDRLEIKPAGPPSFTSNVPELEGDPSNLIVRAAQLFNEAVSIQATYAIRLEKNIPIGAGLGGGSSNAGATLRLLNRLHNAPLRAVQLEALGASLGSDVAFFVSGQSARCRGRGELMEPRPFPRDLWICLFKPGFGISTADAYRAYTALPPDQKRGQEEDTVWGKLRNDLEPAVFPKYLLLPGIKGWLKKQPETMLAHMSGSGSTLFAIVRNQADGGMLRNRFRQEFGEQIWTAVCQLNPVVQDGVSLSN
jgi:4-diphosphocytidyl-2-C-methyl-D-erythritol kinase